MQSKLAFCLKPQALCYSYLYSKPSSSAYFSEYSISCGGISAASRTAHDDRASTDGECGSVEAAAVPAHGMRTALWIRVARALAISNRQFARGTGARRSWRCAG
eukprot:6181948-Pleurochrysis_carterae.AAC.2